MKSLYIAAVVMAAFARATAAQVAASTDSLYVSGEGTAGLVDGGGGGVDWVHAVSSRSTVTAGGASMHLGSEAWTYGTFGGSVRPGTAVYSGGVSAGAGRSGSAGFSYLRLVGAATVPVARTLSAETEAQVARIAGASVKVWKGGIVYTAQRQTTLRLAYIGASSPLQYWQYLFARGDVAVGPGRLLAGVTAGSGPSRLGPLGPELLLHTSQEAFVGASARVNGFLTTAVADFLRQPGGQLTRVMVTVQVPLHAASSPAEAGK